MARLCGKALLRKEEPVGKFKVGIIGAGAISKAHIKEYMAWPDVEVAAAADILPERAEKAKAEFGLKYAFGDYREMLKMDELDAVSVCTPPFAHMGPAIDALKAGKHVLCEKPMAMNAAEAAKMVAAAKKYGRKLAVCCSRNRFSVQARAAKAFVEEGELGDIYYARTTFLRRRGRPGLDMMKDQPWFLDKSKAGGGALNDMAQYHLDFTLWLLGYPKPVSVSGFTFRGVHPTAPKGLKHDVDEHVSAFIRMENGFGITLEEAWAAHMSGADGVFVFGTKGGIKTNPLTFYKDVAGRFADITPVFPKEDAPRVCQEFVQAIREGRDPATRGEDALVLSRICDAIHESTRTGKEVRL